MTKEKQIEKWLTLFRQSNEYYPRAVYELHKMNYFEADAEFDFKKRKVYADKILRRAKREIAQGKIDSIEYFAEKLKELKFKEYILELINLLETEEK